MAETVQSLDQLSQLKPATPEAPKYVKKVDKFGRAYATGKRKDAVARVWIKPGAGKVVAAGGRDIALFNVDGDFYAIDPMLFSPAEVIVTAIDSGESYHMGAVHHKLLDASFA